MNPFTNKQCRPYSQQEACLSIEQVNKYKLHVPNWTFDKQTNTLKRSVKFENYYQTMAFVNALAWVVHQQDHHPKLTVTYNQCDISYTTHSVAGITDNDFICATQIEQIITALS